MAEQNNQVARELKWLDMKEPDPSLLDVRELRGMSVNEALHTPSIRQLPLGLICVHSALQNLNNNDICLPPPLNKSTPASVSTISPQSSSTLDTEQGESIGEAIKKAVDSKANTT